MKVIALDPGVTTGYASGIIDNGKLGVVSGQAKWLELDLYSQLGMSGAQYIIYERFEYRSQRAYNVDNANLFARNLIGVINLYLQQHTEVMYHMQMPATVLGKQAYWSNEKLKAAQVYKVANPHANDAMRHLLYWWKFGPGFKWNTNGFEPLA